MKKFLCLMLSMVLLTFLPVLAFAGETDAAVRNVQIEYFEDGTYLVSEIITENNWTRATKSANKTSTCYSIDNEALWTVKLNAAFSYNGSTATCTAASTDYTIYDNNWDVVSATASKSGNRATGEFTVKKYLLGIPIDTKEVTLTLTCSPTGTIS